MFSKIWIWQDSKHFHQRKLFVKIKQNDLDGLNDSFVHSTLVRYRHQVFLFRCFQILYQKYDLRTKMVRKI